MSSSRQTRTYNRADSVVFLKTKEAFGGLSNMAGGFPLKVNDIHIRSSEALYQTCRFPHMPEVQELIIKQKSPMTAKMKGKPHRTNSRPDWDRVRVKIMRWCLRVKLAQNWAKFSKLLLETGERPIVEESRKDDFWGAKPTDEQTLVGMNVLGRLLMELREEVKSRNRASLLHVEPLEISDFRLYGRQIQPVEAVSAAFDQPAATQPKQPTPPSAPPAMPMQASLFDQPPPHAKTKARRRGMHKAAGLTDGLKPYPDMKDSGVPWLGKVPTHWDVVTLGRVGRLFKGNGGTKEDEAEAGIPCIRYGHLYTQYEFFIRTCRSFVSPDRASNYTSIRYGDVLFAGSGETIEEIGKSAVNLLDSEARCGGDILVWRATREVIPSYLGYAADCPQSVHQKSSMGRGMTVMHIYADQLKYLWIALPPLTEQSAIVRFLYHADRRIGRAIRAKQELIALLNEQKQAIIHEAVTRGLDPNVLLKPSGVEWMGDIPAHWEVRRAKYLFRELDRRSTTGAEVLLSLRMHKGLVPHNEASTIPVTPEALVGFKKVAPGQVVMNRMRAAIGMFGVAHRSGIVSPDYAIFDPDYSVDTEYYLALFKTRKVGTVFRQESKGLGTGSSGFLRLYTHRFGVIKMPVPPKEEQSRIARAYKVETRSIERTEEYVNREVSFLREYHARLIADVVTGKLDVRAAAAELPEEVDNAKPFDEADTLIDSEENRADALDAHYEGAPA